MSNSQLTIDLKSVSYIKFFYQNQHGQTRKYKPKAPTFDSFRISSERAPIIPDHPEFDNETMIERAIRRGIIDHWFPVCIYQFRNNHSLRFIRDEAKKMRDAYNKHIYNGK